MQINIKKIKNKLYEKIPNILPEIIKEIIVHIILFIYHISMPSWVFLFKIKKRRNKKMIEMQTEGEYRRKKCKRRCR